MFISNQTYPLAQEPTVTPPNQGLYANVVRTNRYAMPNQRAALGSRQKVTPRHKSSNPEYLLARVKKRKDFISSAKDTAWICGLVMLIIACSLGAILPGALLCGINVSTLTQVLFATGVTVASGMLLTAIGMVILSAIKTKKMWDIYQDRAHL